MDSSPDTPQQITDSQVVKVAVPVPLNRLFDYRVPAGMPGPQPGCRVQVPFGRRSLVGWVVESDAEPEIDQHRLLDVQRVIDLEPLFPDTLWSLLNWTWRYYQHAPGEVISAALPPPLRTNRPLPDSVPVAYGLHDAGAAPDPGELAGRAPRQAELLQAMQAGPVRVAELAELNGQWRPQVRTLMKKGWVRAFAEAELEGRWQTGPELSEEQSLAVQVISAEKQAFQCYLLDGITGSGKTEVYLHLLRQQLDAGRQSLILVPEIGLTPQLVRRFRQRLGVRPVIAHSAMSDGERAQAWVQAARGEAPLVIGTRSAVFYPLARPGIIIVDEEHDASFKQHEGLRYHARDTAVQRAVIENIPIVLGSATPSLESCNNAVSGRYRAIRLRQRVSGGELPRWRLVDLRDNPLREGVSKPVFDQLGDTLARREQALVFLNRRGYAPVMMCHHCGTPCDCHRCDAHMVLHRKPRLLRCHRCGLNKPVPAQCVQCGGLDMRAVGEGTERIDELFSRHFPGTPVIRFDRDSTRRKDSLEAMSSRVRSGEPCILVGTQILAKGHHFPGVSLAVILNVDQALYSADFRAMERLGQLLTQVAGRAGRGESAGTVLLQTYHPEHPFLKDLLQSSYSQLAGDLLAERKAAHLPPYSYHCMLRAECHRPELLNRFVDAAAALAAGHREVELFDPMPAIVPMIAGRHRMQILVQADSRGPLHRFISAWLRGLEQLKESRRVRWSIDIDPQEF